MQDKIEYIRVGACEMQAAYFNNKIVYISPTDQDIVIFYDAVDDRFRAVPKYTIKLSELSEVGRIFYPRVLLFDYTIFPPIYMN